MTIRRYKKHLAQKFMAFAADDLRHIYDDALDSGSDYAADLTYSGLSRRYRRSCEQGMARCTASIRVVRAEARRRVRRHQDPTLLVQYVAKYVPKRELRTCNDEIPF